MSRENARRLLLAVSALLLVWQTGCSGLGGGVAEEPQQKIQSSRPRFRLEKVETSGSGLPRNQVRKHVRVRLAMFRWCYESFL